MVSVLAAVLGFAGFAALIVASALLLAAAVLTWDLRAVRHGCAWMTAGGVLVAACCAADRFWPMAAVFGSAAAGSAAVWAWLGGKQPGT